MWKGPRFSLRREGLLTVIRRFGRWCSAGGNHEKVVEKMNEGGDGVIVLQDQAEYF